MNEISILTSDRYIAVNYSNGSFSHNGTVRLLQHVKGGVAACPAKWDESAEAYRLTAGERAGKLATMYSDGACRRAKGHFEDKGYQVKITPGRFDA